MHLKKRPKIVQEIREQYPDKQREMWFQDETRIGQKGRRTRTWARKGSRPIGVMDTRYANAYLFGAFCPARDVAVGLILPKANRAMMQLHLNEISTQIPANTQAIIITDRAGWHSESCLDIPSNITLIKIPPYSPQLNPAEKVWQYLKDNFISNTLFDSYKDIIEKTSQVWQQLTQEKGRITSLTTHPIYQIT